jgi:hypothetical protein
MFPLALVIGSKIYFVSDKYYIQTLISSLQLLYYKRNGLNTVPQKQRLQYEIVFHSRLLATDQSKVSPFKGRSYTERTNGLQKSSRMHESQSQGNKEHQ